jgi:hypothetical protein
MESNETDEESRTSGRTPFAGVRPLSDREEFDSLWKRWPTTWLLPSHLD